MSRFDTNLNIIELISNSHELKKFSGFGGLHKTMTREQHLKLKSILGDKHYQEAMASTKNAYYTPTPIIEFIYNAILKIGFTGGRVLEPACGHGAFIFNMPQDLIQNSTINGVELNRLSARIAKMICPYANILNAGFEQTKFSNDTFNLIIGNPPFGSQIMKDDCEELNGMAIHHYFTAKSVMLLKQGGIMAMVLPQYCFDNTHDHPRKIMQKHGSLIAAFRLPDCMFENAKVTVDLVFYIKDKINDIKFTETKSLMVNGNKLSINEYYINNPHHVIGNLNTCNMYGDRIGLTVTANYSKADIYKKLNNNLSTLPSIYKNHNPPKQDILASLDKAIQKLKEKANSMPEIEKHLLNFEIEKLCFLQKTFKAHKTKEHELLKNITNTISSIQ